jgi:hypothetical protein
MSKVLIIAALLTLVISSLAAADLPFIEEYFYPRSVIVAFTQEAIGNRYGEIDVSYHEGLIRTHLSDLNRLAEEYRIVDLVQMHEFVTHLDWNDEGIYLQNIYRIVLEKNENIEELQAALTRTKDVIFAEYETINRTRELFIPNDPDYYLQWQHPKMKMPQAWNYVQGSSEVVVAITDTGVKWNHVDLRDNIWINEPELAGITIDWDNGMIYGGDGIDNDQNGYIDDIIGWDFVEQNNNPYQSHPDNQHGTHVAGCAGAVGNNGIGVTGTAINVSLMSCKGAPSHAPSGGVQYGYNQIQYAAQSGADIINCSWGGPGSGTYPNSVINYATALGSLVIAAAGNSDLEHGGSYQDYPADAENAFCVASTDQNDVKTYFSDYGDPIDISAPGINIRSTWYNSQGNDSYHSTQGTSMSSPIVAGVAALVKTLHPELDPVALKNRIMDNADYIDDLNPDYAGLLGTGRVNAFKAAMYDKIPHITIYNHSVHEHSGDGDGISNPGEEINLRFNLYNEIFWLSATGVTGIITTDMPGVEILVGTVNFPDINGGSIVGNTNEPFRFSTDPTISELTIPFTLTITANQGNPFPYEISFEQEVTLSLQRSGWPLQLSGISSTSAALVDLDGSGTRELIFGDPQGNLRVVNTNKNPLPGFPVNVGTNITSAIAVADLNNNNNAEIVVNSQNDGIISCVDTSGTILFQYNAGGQLRTNPMLVDVNNNGNLEIVALTFSNPRLIILNHDGSDYPGFPVSISGAVLASPATADLNGDGHKEIVFATSTGSLHAISTSSGQDISGWPQTLNSASWNGPVVGDVTGNGQPDVVVATIPGMVYAFNSQGNEIFTKTVGNQVRSGILVHDLNNDGNNEVIFADMNGNIYATDSSGTNWGVFPVNTGSPIESTPVLADMNRDGNLDIIYGDNDGYLHSINLSGQETANFPIFIGGGSITVSPAIASFDGTSKPDILVPNGNGFNCIDYKRYIGEIGWGFFKGSNRRTGNYFDKTSTDEIPEDNIIMVTRLHGNYPNPFNPDTRISFSLAEDSEVSVTIYNIKGQQVRSLVSDYLSRGDHTINWNGTDDRGRDVGTGMYFYRLQTNDYEKTRKMMLLK